MLKLATFYLHGFHYAGLSALSVECKDKIYSHCLLTRKHVDHTCLSEMYSMCISSYLHYILDFLVNNMGLSNVHLQCFFNLAFYKPCLIILVI